MRYLWVTSCFELHCYDNLKEKKINTSRKMQHIAAAFLKKTLSAECYDICIIPNNDFRIAFRQYRVPLIIFDWMLAVNNKISHRDRDISVNSVNYYYNYN